MGKNSLTFAIIIHEMRMMKAFKFTHSLFCSFLYLHLLIHLLVLCLSFVRSFIHSFILSLGTLQPEPLQCLAIKKKTVFASYGRTIKAFHRGKEVRVYHGHEGDVHTIIPFGDHLLAVDDTNTLIIWHAMTKGM